MTPADPKYKTFKVDLKTEIPYGLIGILLILIYGLIKGDWSGAKLVFLAFLSAIWLVYCILIKRLHVISINYSSDEVVLTKSNVLGSRRHDSFPLSLLQFCYKVEKPGFRHRIVNICRLYVKDKEIAVIIPDHDGWTDEDVQELTEGLFAIGVSKKHTGYSLKDAPIDTANIGLPNSGQVLNSSLNQ